MEKIYVVYGSTGEYSDRGEWTVAAYSDEAHAKQHVEAATKRANEIEVLCGGARHFDPDRYQNEYDKNMGMDYTGTSYYYGEVEFYGDVLEYKLMI